MVGFGDRLKKVAKAVNDANRTIQATDAILHGRPPPSSPAFGSAPSPPGAATPPAPTNVRCAYCGGLVTKGTPKCPNCNAPM